MLSASRRSVSSRAFRRTRLFAVAVLAASWPVFGQAAATIHPVSTATTLSSETVSNGKTILTVHVTPAPAPQAPEDRGTVMFVDRAADGTQHALGSALVAPDGTASLTTASLTSGEHQVSALYSGTTAALASTSEPLAVSTEVAAPDFALTAAPTSLNVDAGVQAAVAVTITPSNNFSNYVSLSCAGLPLYATCTFLPSNVAVEGKTGVSTMTLNTLAPSGHTSMLRRDTGLVYAFLLPGVAGLLGLGFGRGRGLRTLAMLCVLTSVVGGTSSCAQRYRYYNYGPSDNPGTPAGESIIRIYGTSVNGAVSTIKCIQLTLNVSSSNTSGTAGNNLTPCS